MSKIYTIYKATNLVNGKSYIGFDSCWPNRKVEHENNARKGIEFAFYKALRKYGKESFEWSVLYQSEDREHTLNTMESHYIKECKSHLQENGYNMTYGGEGTIGRVLSEQTKKKISNSKKGIVVKTSRIYEKGTKHSVESVKRMAEKHAKTYRFLKNGEIIEVLNLAQFCKMNELNNGHMNAVFHGKRKQHKGFYSANFINN
jgi:group I intron endonuclease